MGNTMRGFTLLELMIAILLFAMVSTAAYKLFTTVTKAQQVTDGIFEDLDVLQRARVIIEKDLFQFAPRPIRDEFGESQPAVLSPSKSGAILEFTREGWRNPLKTLRSNMQRVAYYLEDGNLIRSYWPMLDRPSDPVQIDQLLLSNVDRIRLRFLDEKKRWHSSWPPEKQSAEPAKVKDKQASTPVMPYAVEMTVSHGRFGNIVMVQPLLDYKESESQKQHKDPQQQQRSRGQEKKSSQKFRDESDDEDMWDDDQDEDADDLEDDYE